MAKATTGDVGISLPAGASVIFPGLAARLLEDIFDPGGPRAVHNRDAVGFVFTYESAVGHVECPRIFPVDHIEGAGGAGGGLRGVDR